MDRLPKKILYTIKNNWILKYYIQNGERIVIS
jgi:hypothetical protein